MHIDAAAEAHSGHAADERGDLFYDFHLFDGALRDSDPHLNVVARRENSILHPLSQPESDLPPMEAHFEVAEARADAQKVLTGRFACEVSGLQNQPR